ncbi:P-loop containing nucleoside triphosphate hydrolase protein [Stachybotrys elegans]|uniref:P-loop containing nucleoside triphosphate hydrolase protein n=1 Tax=Stachybotrys elegans TaxID=80388 RepID=A0A8K0T919_9HYPO|nr:P-loop containing nucleoside triphosphate hydrolase protein [Stachybotrys elegans]
MDLQKLEIGATLAVAALSALVFLLYISRSWIFLILPRWLKPFATETAPHGLKRVHWTAWTLCLGFIAIAGLALSIVSLLLKPTTPIEILGVVPWVSSALITAFDRPVKTPLFLFAQYLILLAAHIAHYSIKFLHHSPLELNWFDLASPVLCLMAITVIINMPFRDPSWGPADIGNRRLPPSEHLRSPEDNMSLFQFWTMNWVYPLAKLRNQRELVVQDIWQLPYSFQHSRLYVAFNELQGKLLYCLLEANGLELFLSTTLTILIKIAQVSTIRLTAVLYRALDDGGRDEAVFWCLLILGIDVLQYTIKSAADWFSRKAYERSRGETFIALFTKLLTRAMPGSDVTEKGPADEDEDEVPASKSQGFLSRLYGRFCGRRKRIAGHEKHQAASNAKVVNLVRGDTYEISQRVWDFRRLVSEPIKLFVTIYYLIDIMGWPSCVGIGLMIFFLICNSWLLQHLIKLERKRTALSDKRAQAVSHFVEASRPLKLNGWTGTWSNRIMKFRAQEMLRRFQIALISATIATINVLGGASYPLASISLYALFLNRGLPNDVIWPSLQLFEHLKVSLQQTFELVSAYWTATIPVGRVHDYLDEPDRNEQFYNSGSQEDIEFIDASFAWQGTSKPVLEELSLKFPKGLTLVRGKVGSGKSSLLLAALNEMELLRGGIAKPNEPIGYTQQLPWLQNKTIRDNILFYHPYDPERYRQVLHACALLTDLAMLPNGDLNKLEEGGVGLSGGQKARVALARAVYSPSRILLLDDPFAALDHDTASTIVQRFLKGPLAEDRTIVLVTHRDDLVLRFADQVVDLDSGHAKILSPEEIQQELEHPYHDTKDSNGQAAQDSTHEEHAGEISNEREEPEEPAPEGGVPMSVYGRYMKAGGWYMWIILIFFFAASRFFDIYRARLLEAWGDNTATDEPEAGITTMYNFWGLPDPSRYPRPWLYALSVLSLGQVITFAIAQLLLAKISIDAAQGLFKTAVERVGRATFRYHDTTPTGQLKNRLISDMSMVDGGILTPLQSLVYSLIALSMSVVAIATQQPMLLGILCIVTFLFVYYFSVYIPTSRSLRRMEMRYLTPIIANIGVMQDGLVSIRAFQAEEHFKDRHLQAVDNFQQQDHFFWGIVFWTCYRLGMSTAATRAALTLSMILRGTPASAIGFVLTQTSIAMDAVQDLCNAFAQLQLDAVSLERVEMLNKIPEEANGDETPPKDWPRPCDAVTFEDMSFKYAEDLPPVLHNVTFEIPGGTTCAVLGRTGSGKSTIANALLATELPSTGMVKIGSMDLSRIDRQVLRDRITYIQQDPILFPGTLRDNIDPEGKFSESECSNAVRRVLGPGFGLETQIDAAGKNLSQGQRQLVGIARAVLRQSGLVIMDEATASIDRTTAAVVQRLLREELSKSTVITIAHRLEAVEDANWCLRLDKGNVVECGPAQDLSKQARSGEFDEQ